LSALRRLIAAGIALALVSQAQAQPAPSARLSLVAGAPVQTGDVAGAGTLYYGALGVAPALSLNLAGLAAGSINDVFQAPGPVMCTAPTPLGAGGYQLLTGGTPIGGMTANGGLSAAFNGIIGKGYAASAKSSAAVAAYDIANAAGLSFAAPVTVTQIKAWSPVDDGFQGSLSAGGWQLLASNGSFTTAVTIASGSYGSGNGATVSHRFQNTASYLNYWFVIYGNGVQNSYVDQVQLFQSMPVPARGIATDAFGDDQSDHDIPNCNAGGGLSVDCPVGGCYHLGAIQIDAGAPGQISCLLSYGLDRGCGIWNARNRETICLHAGDPSPPVQGPQCHPGIACFAYTPAIYATQPPYQFGPSHGNPLIRLRVLSGLPTQSIRATYRQGYFLNATAAAAAYWFAIGLNDTTEPTGHWPSPNVDNSGTGAPAIGTSVSAEAIVLPFTGIAVFNAIEGSRGGASGFYGEGNQELSACYRY
jgi:hypothetical protein